MIWQRHREVQQIFSLLQKLRVKATQKMAKGTAKQNAVLKKFGFITSENEVKAVAAPAKA